MVEPIPDLRGTYVAHAADIQADEKTMGAILAAFRRADEGLQRGDLNAVMALYSEHYIHRGYTKPTIRSVWRDLLEQYGEFSVTHMFSQITVETDRVPRTAQVLCTGSLWAISKATGRRVNLDSWYGEVHYLVEEDGAWRLQGHAWEMLNSKETRFAPSPHPFF